MELEEPGWLWLRDWDVYYRKPTEVEVRQTVTLRGTTPRFIKGKGILARIHALSFFESQGKKEATYRRHPQSQDITKELPKK